MRDVPATMSAAWKSGDHTGQNRPVARVVVSHNFMKLRNYTLTSTYSRLSSTSSTTPSSSSTGVINPTKGEKIDQCYADFLWSNTAHTPKEVPNVLSVAWTRSVNTEIAECTVVMKNSAPLANGQQPIPHEFEQPGYYHPYYGASSFSRSWGHTQNAWLGMLMPDNVIRTYEGYGSDGPGVAPERDTRLVCTGVWLIDQVEPSALGMTLTIRCRDLGRLFLEQKVYAPVIPPQFYPVTFRNWDETVRVGGTEVKKGRLTAKPLSSSNEPWGVSSVGGHTLNHAFDGSGSSFWLSIGNDRPSRRFAYEWVEATVKGNVSEVRFTPKKKGYTAYLSLMVNGAWVGARQIDYHEDGIGRNGADINYYRSMQVTHEGEHRFAFKAVKNVTRVRVTFGNLQYFPAPGPYHYRAGIRDVKVFGETVKRTVRDVPLTEGPAGANPSRCSDYTDIVKLASAWAGLFWPVTASRKLSDGTTVAWTPADFDTETLGKGVKGAVWGDFEQTGTAPVVPIDISNFDKKSLLDMVTYVRDIIGFYFAIDESGAVQWRMPNFFELGNYRTGLSAQPGRTSAMLVLDDQTVVRDLSSKLSSGSVREGIWVGDTTGKFTVVRPGWNPNPTGMRRMGGWTDQNFNSVEEARMMGDMIAMRQLMEYWKDTVTIYANPALQIDDQVRILDRRTSEGYVHYVRSVASNNDLTTGEWTYNLETNWLGQDPKSRWVFTQAQLGEEARLHIRKAVENTTGVASRLGEADVL